MDLTAATTRTYRWGAVAVMGGFTMPVVDRSTWGSASVSMGEHLGVSLAELCVFATGYYIGYMIYNASGGVLTNWIGGCVILSSTLFAAGGFLILFGETTSIALGIAYQACIGVFTGCDYPAGVKLISQRFQPVNRGFALGVFMSASSLGTVIANAVVPSLIEACGWRASYDAFGIASMIVAVLCFVFLRNGTESVTEPCQLPGWGCSCASWRVSAAYGAPTASSPGSTRWGSKAAASRRSKRVAWWWSSHWSQSANCVCRHGARRLPRPGGRGGVRVWRGSAGRAGDQRRERGDEVMCRLEHHADRDGHGRAVQLAVGG
ncbi:MFS transporter [Streptomyces massasporeus]|uniref:MFS transporter n=1 Tax=Streptomyces massasporeus TaxID=67324 RepID=UPI0036A3CF61